MSKFFSRAKFYYETCEDQYKKSKIANAEEHIALTCYYIQLSIEFNLKGLIEYYGNGKKFKFTHSISDQLVIIDEIKGAIYKYDDLDKIIKELEPWSSEITSWNAEARYNFDFVKTINAIESTMKIAKKLTLFTNDIMKISDNPK